MDWALENGSANILTHLRKLGYAIPEDLVIKYQELVVSYLLQEYPLIVRERERKGERRKGESRERE